MKIAMVGQKGIPASFGGIERHVEAISQRLVQKGHTVYVYSRFWYTRTPSTTYQGVQSVLLPSIHTKHLDAISHTFFSIIDAMKKHVDVIHFHGVGPALLSWIPRLFAPKIEVVTTFHCIDRYHQKWGRLARLVLYIGEWSATTFSHKTIVVSQTLKYYCEKHYRKEVYYIPNGFTESKNSNMKISKFGLEPQKYILSVSRLIKHKGIHYLIDAFNKLKKQGQLVDMKLVIVGSGYNSGKYESDLHAMALNNPDIVFLGTLDAETLTTLYKNAYLFVHPSETEGLPLVILEAMGYGAPVLGSDIPEIRELITDERFLFQSKNIDSLVDKIFQLTLSPELLKESSLRKQDMVYQNYSWDDIANKISQLYTSDSLFPHQQTMVFEKNRK